MLRKLVLPLLAVMPAALLAESATPSLGYAGAPTDHNGQTCVTCHNTSPANSDARGSLTVMVNDYVPNSPQTIRIILRHPQFTHFGFQISIRQVSDETQTSGNLSLVNSTDPVQVLCDDGSNSGSKPPCNNLRQFAEQKNAPFGTADVPYEFDLLWDPPAPEVGKLHVYVAAVAGDGNGTVSGDSVYTFVKTIANAGSCSLTAKPLLRTPQNAASGGTDFSSNALVSIFGTGFLDPARQRSAGLGDFTAAGFPTELACVSVQATGPGIAQPVLLPITYVQADQINVQMPVFSGTGPVTLRVILNPGQGNQITSIDSTLTGLQPFAPAFFLFANSTSIAAQFAGTATPVANPSVVVGARPARAGDWLTLYGTGFGDSNPSVATGQLASGIAGLVNGITVTIGGTTLAPSDVYYAGLSPGSISGLYQFDVRVPDSAPAGDIPVTISIGGIQTPGPATIPIQK
ncbi:MAG: hypothetical protein LAP38_11265 [Acidobacteriia bacterium]|nr:hypothetical protein [Terriglobia bacterium]